MRNGFDGLSGLVRQGLLKDPLSGDIFIFFNKRRSQVKLLVFQFIINAWSVVHTSYLLPPRWNYKAMN